jgi:tetratricopeptide (TPR) repeat protein
LANPDLITRISPMPVLRWTLAVGLLIAAVAFAAPLFWTESTEPIGTESELAAEQFRLGSGHLRRMEVEEARSALEKSIEVDPAFAMAHFELGHALLWLNERTKGREQILLADSLAHAPGATTELERLVIGIAAGPLQDDQAKAEDYYDRLERDYADHPLSLRAQAQRAMADGDQVRARRLYLAVLDADPSRVEVHNTLGYMALEEGLYEEAVSSFKRYVYFADDSANPHDSLGEAFLWTGRYHESIEQFRIALEIDPSFLSSVLGATDALAVTGQFTLARKFLSSFEELFERRGEWGMKEVRSLQVDYMAEAWADVAARTGLLRADQEAFAEMEPGLRLWVNTLGAIGLTELGRNDEARALIDEAETSFEYLLSRIDSDDLRVRENLQLLRASLHCRIAIVEGRSAAKELAQLRGLIEASTLQPHRLLSFQGVLIESLYDAGLDAEALEFAPRVLAFNPNHPRTLLVSAKAEARQRNRETALDYLSRSLEVMRQADESHVRVDRARQLYDRLAPSS